MCVIQQRVEGRSHIERSKMAGWSRENLCNELFVTNTWSNKIETTIVVSILLVFLICAEWYVYSLHRLNLHILRSTLVNFWELDS